MGSVVWREGEGILVNLGCAGDTLLFYGGYGERIFCCKMRVDGRVGFDWVLFDCLSGDFCDGKGRLGLKTK